ncbi:MULTISPECIES: efflux RND transporter periplasmic adaptor subunit [Luteibacter]|uniref:Efflux RND transporter periplasmic adaptor subunit n=1 Tax=Luteibacter flocculans TaxID=2780091 RepID=A0ABY4SYU3_9GAMM|nr:MULTISPECIES: efflux RND transporter periplasmic adaptor subunit [Luteibacter]URL57471.1 efflux RND transporter periplasmic adaptor subunit [Luteibacter flocculans]SFW35139.1 membrane fusion protein, multidrug efflux system [Luteibacter sp. UNCMF366Tsu5.1]
MNPLPLRSSLLALGLAAALAACHKQEAPQQPPPPEVGTITAQPQDAPLVQDQVGRVSAFRTADVRARVPGILLHRLYEEGTDVKAGQKLFQIDPQPLKAELDAQLANLASARATAVNAKAQADRNRGLIGKNYVSRQDLDTAEANQRTAEAAVKQAEANVQSARINLGFTDVVSPIDGRAGQQQVTEGALVGQNETTLLTQVDQIDKVYVNFSVSVSDLDAMRRAAANGAATLSPTDKATVRIQLPDGSDFGEQGVLDFSSATVNPQTGTVNLRAQLANPDLRLLPGQFVTVKATLGDLHNVFLIPQAAVLRDANDAYVMVVGEGHAKDPQTGKDTTVPSAAVRRPIKAERISGSNWVVTGGLKPGDQIIVQGLPKARENAPVKASPAQAAPASAASAPGAAAPAGQQ